MSMFIHERKILRDDETDTTMYIAVILVFSHVPIQELS